MDAQPRRGFRGNDWALLVMGLVFAALAIPGVVPRNQDPVMGTYTQAGCTPQPSGRCRSHGTWTSEDGTVTRTIPWFTDEVGPDGTARATWDPDGPVSSSPRARRAAWWLGVQGPTGPLLVAGACLAALAWRQRPGRRR